MKNYLSPNWPAPKHVRAYTTTRQYGFSQGNFASFNLAAHVGDDATAVQQNRQKLHQELSLPTEPAWLNQIHGTIVVNAAKAKNNPDADASFTTEPQIVCVTMTADCLPLLVCDKAGTCVAAIHAGWKGLALGVIEATIKQLPVNAKDLLVWLGPAIGPASFEVGADVRDQFIHVNREAVQAFKELGHDKWLADIYLLAKQRLHYLGVNHIYGGTECTYTDAERFYSFRRDKVTGRMASLIWMENKKD